MSALDRAALRALAEAATPGPWLHEATHNEFDHVSSRAGFAGDLATTWSVSGDASGDAAANAAYIAAANPSAVLALLDEADRLRRALRHILDGALSLPRFAEAEARAALGRPGA